MFCSTNSGILLPQQLSPGFNLAAALDGFNDEETLLDHDCLDLLFHCLLETPTDKTMCSTKRMSISPEVYRSNGDRSHPLRKHTRRQSEKKDRHSKIFTAQGPRNRRVRLSMDVGRKFFDLQDLLGFDKASKTLDWLLRKSKTAIKELTQMKHVDDPRAKSLCSRSECENLDLQKSTASKKKQRRNPANPKEAKGPRRAAFDTVAKELRASARARARERTKEKNLLRKLTEDKRLPYLNPSISDQPRTWSQIGSYSKASESNCYNRISSVNINTGLNGFFFFQPNLIISTESSSNFSQWSQNWDISSAMTSSNLCGLTNMAPSGERQISRKPFYLEEHTATTIKSNVVETLSM